MTKKLKVVFVDGPIGSGKTAYINKLAADLKATSGGKVSLLRLEAPYFNAAFSVKANLSPEVITKFAVEKMFDHIALIKRLTVVHEKGYVDQVIVEQSFVSLVCHNLYDLFSVAPTPEDSFDHSVIMKTYMGLLRSVKPFLDLGLVVMSTSPETITDQLKINTPNGSVDPVEVKQMYYRYMTIYETMKDVFPHHVRTDSSDTEETVKFLLGQQ